MYVINYAFLRRTDMNRRDFKDHFYMATSASLGCINMFLKSKALYTVADKCRHRAQKQHIITALAAGAVTLAFGAAAAGEAAYYTIKHSAPGPLVINPQNRHSR
jgi:hypothetical protein